MSKWGFSLNDITVILIPVYRDQNLQNLVRSLIIVKIHHFALKQES